MPETPWRPSRATTVTLGVLSVWPLIYMAIFGMFFIYTWFSFANPQTPHAAGPPSRAFMYIFPLHCLTMLLSFALTGVYIFHAYRSDRLEQDKRILWVVILFFGNMIAFPIYWYLYLWREGAPLN
jgi:hypothetical protein